MSESKSTSVSIDVYSSKFPACKAIFPHRLVRPLRKYPIDHQVQLCQCLDDLKECGATIDNFVGDNPKRSNAKNVLGHSSNFPCEYCFAKGVRFSPKRKDKQTEHFLKIREKLRDMNDGADVDITEITAEIDKTEKQMKTRKTSHITWPASTRNGEPRTIEKIMEIVERLESGERLPPDEAKGVIGRSPLMELEGFDFVLDSPTEYLHSVCLGVTKRMIILTFSVGEKRYRVTTRKLSDPALFNALMQKVKVFREFSRRNRELDFAVLKGQEFRNILLFFFPVVIKCIPRKAPERKLWLLLVFMIRSCVLPPQEFRNFDLDEIERACEQFYILYEKLFGPGNCSYNTHVVCSHLLEMRHHGPLTCTSAFSFESFYGEIRNSFVPGTQSTLKQIFRNILLKRALTFHCCENSIYYSEKDTALENNSLIYCFKDLEHVIYKIREVRKDSVICLKYGKRKHTFEDLPTMNCSHLGIYKKGVISDEKIKIMKKNIDGKVLDIENLFITCPNNILREK